MPKAQRVHTSGGLPPERGCSEATAGKQSRIAYTADYYFFTQSAPMALGSQGAGIY